MGIETTFKFAHKRSKGGVEAPADLLGDLRAFVGTHGKRTWRGEGFNLIWRPNHGGASGPKDFFLELNQTSETLEFTDITGTGVGNRGFNQDDIFLGAVAYLQQISDRTGPQHFEPGVWAHAPATGDPSEQATVIRMGSIPHGTSINLQGVADHTAAPQISPTTITPFTIGSIDDGAHGLIHFPEEQNVQTPMPSRTSPGDLPGLDDSHLSNPNLFLEDVLARQTVLSTTVFTITSEVKSLLAPGATPAAPDTGGGSDSIAFLVGGPHGPNAGPARVTAKFWVERVRDRSGKEFDQLQYTQRVLLNFNNLSWPHISVATLR